MSAPEEEHQASRPAHAQVMGATTRGLEEIPDGLALSNFGAAEIAPTSNPSSASDVPSLPDVEPSCLSESGGEADRLRSFALKEVAGLSVRMTIAHLAAQAETQNVFATRRNLMNSTLAGTYPAVLLAIAFPEAAYAEFGRHPPYVFSSRGPNKRNPALACLNCATYPRSLADKQTVSEYATFFTQAAQELVSIEDFPAWLENQTLKGARRASRDRRALRRQASPSDDAPGERTEDNGGAETSATASVTMADADVSHDPGPITPSETDLQSGPNLSAAPGRGESAASLASDPVPDLQPGSDFSSRPQTGAAALETSSGLTDLARPSPTFSWALTGSPVHRKMTVRTLTKAQEERVARVMSSISESCDAAEIAKRVYKALRAEEQHLRETLAKDVGAGSYRGPAGRNPGGGPPIKRSSKFNVPVVSLRMPRAKQNHRVQDAEPRS